MNPADIESHLRLVLLQWMVIITVARLGKRFFGQPLELRSLVRRPPDAVVTNRSAG